ncbi:MopE-related protein [Polyangium spumosum]|uniref:MAM domain-containing protein n=1 Tax=Polyangium spumosum TaxID=889282 RepID=A0A6N7PRF7_9BACT|nr:MopE-related protein [Polyangium spumosum]MRG91441.1 hypothetical protein [Polyangium spumosum]
MRSTIPATLVALGCLAIHAFGCAGGTDETTSAGQGGSAGAGAAGGAGGAGGGGGQGGAGGAMCTPTDELCDGVDNDCDEQVDEDCPCIDGQTQSCYSGDPTTEGVGPCTPGQQTCDEKGAWGPCIGQVVPKSQESCNGIDDDCNGEIDDMGLTACGVGACRVEVVTCENGQLSTCTPLPPSLEVCDGVDNDCDQLTDEVFPDAGKTCSTGLAGVCAAGKFACDASGAKTCVPDVTPVPETCNGADDDCDGTVDEDIPGTGGQCGTGMLGVCAAGAIQCNGTTIDCFPITPLSPEACNGLDDDCDGEVDENNPGAGVACQTGLSGVCATGKTKCESGTLSCLADASDTPEICNGLDENCDGVIDDGNPGGGAACGCGGTTVCEGGGLVCQGNATLFLDEDFADAPGWTLGSEWEVKAAVASGTCTNLSGTHSDPATDTSPTDDNKVAGVIVGGCSTSSQSATLHGYYYLTSPPFDASAAPGVHLQFQRWLNSDITPYMNNVIEVFNGTSWVQVWQSGSSSFASSSWTKVTYDLSQYKNANMRIRWGFNIGSSLVYPMGSWNIDDVVVSTTPCP